MRILVTKQGNIIIQEIDDSIPIMSQINTFNNSHKFRGYSNGNHYPSPKRNNNQIRLNKYSKTNQFFNYSNFSNKSNSKRFVKTGTKFLKNINKINLEDIELTKDEINSAKQIKLIGRQSKTIF